MRQDGSPDGSATSAPEPRVRWLRGDVDGLRAVAIVLVVLFHAGVPALSNGFVGVDVFFVISGYLITRNLLRDATDGTRIGLLDFWARRLRRLVPALAVVVAATLVGSALLLPTFQLRDTAVQGAAAALYVSNLLFARQSADYFAGDLEASPFLHTWSLGIEEQFYLFWPVLFVAAALLARRWWPTRLRTVLVVGFGATLVASMAVNLHLSSQESAWAFYGLPARAWEFAAAGLVAALPVGGLAHRRSIGTALAAAGTALLVAALVAIPDDAVYPGWWAVLPVGATVALILAGSPDGTGRAGNPLSGVLALRPLQWLGRLSYSWYLWHWPAMVLAVAWWGEDTVGLRLAAGAASLAVAWVAYRFVENPVRFSRPLVASLGRTYALAVLATLVVLGIAGVVRGIPERTPVESIEGQVLAAHRSHRHDACGQRPTFEGLRTCATGDLGSDTDLLVLGDSHAEQWKPALAAWGRERGVRVLDHVIYACPAIGVAVTNLAADIEAQERCAGAWDDRQRLIEAVAPDAVLVVQWSGYLDRILGDDGGDPPVPERLERWAVAYEDMIGAVAEAGAGLAVVLDEPELPTDPLVCVEREGDLEPCAVPRDEALATIGPLRDVELAVLDGRDDIARLDMVETLCTEERCAVGIDGVLAYSDRQHLNEAFVTGEVDELGAVLDEALSAGPPAVGDAPPPVAGLDSVRAAELANAPGSHRHPACTAREDVADLEVCVVGDVEAEAQVLVLGDTHAEQWKPVLDELGRAEGVRVVLHTIQNCPAIGVVVAYPGGDAGREASCAAAHERRRQLLAEVAPEVVLVAQWAGYLPRVLGPDGEALPPDAGASTWQRAHEELMAEVDAAGAELVVVLDEPLVPEDPVACIEDRGIDACTPTRADALAGTTGIRTAELAALAGAPDVRHVDLVEALCDDETCALRSRDALVYADRQHLTASFVRAHPDLLAEPVLAALADAGR